MTSELDPLSQLRWLLVALFLLAPNVSAQWGREAVVQPRDFTSRSGEFVLRVDPSSPSGLGSASYRMTRKGKETWAGRLPYTLIELQVADSGSVAGYAYGSSEVLVVTLAPDGKPLRVDATARTSSDYPDASPNPVVEGLLLQESLDRFVVRIADEDLNRQSERWWIFRLSTGERRGEQRPRDAIGSKAGRASLLGAEAVRDTPLILVHWLEIPDQGPFGARFALLDAEGARTWELERAGDYANGPDYSLVESVRRHAGGAILRCEESHAYELWFASDRQRTRFEVSQEPGGSWNVRLASRAPQASLDLPVPGPLPAPSQGARLPLAGTIELGARTAEPAVHGVGAFAFDGQGNCAFLSWEHDPYRVVLAYVDPEGQGIARNPLAFQDPGSGQIVSDIEWIQGSEFIVAFTTWSRANRGPGRVFAVSARTGDSREVASIPGGEIHDLARLHDGGFLVLGDNRLEAFGPDGKRRWTRTSSDRLCGAENLGVSGHGDIVLVDRGGKALQWVGPDGTIGRYELLSRLLSREARYPTWIQPDLEGGWLLKDFDSLLRLDANGRLLGELAARFANGRKLSRHRTVRLGPDGRRWATDGHAIARLGATGIADLVLGDPPDCDRLGSVACLELDLADRIYAVSERTGHVFVHDKTGELLRIGRTAASDFSSDPDLRSEALAIDGQGGFFLVIEGSCLHWSADGTRKGLEGWPVRSYGERLLPQWGSSNAWRIERGALKLVNPDGRALASFDRKPDGTWLQPTSTAAVASDGSIAVVCGDASKDSTGGDSVVIAAPDGVLKAVVRLGRRDSDPEGIAFDGKRVAGVAGSTLHLCEVASGKSQAFELEGVPQEHQSSWRPYFAHDCDELWLFDGKHTLRRYELSIASAPR